MTAPLDALSAKWPHLRRVFREHWDTPIPRYAEALWDSPPTGSVDPLFEAALRRESVRVTGSEAAAGVVLRRRVVSTAHHVTPTNGPGFLAADWIASAAPDTQPVVVLAWSGVSLSNTAWSGCLSFTAPVLVPGSPTDRRARKARADRARDAGDTEERLWLFPARMRDALLYRLPIHPRLAEVLGDLQPSVSARLPAPVAEDFPTWALRACAAIQQEVLQRPLVYLDLNRVVADYLAAALAAPGHPLAALLSRPERWAARLPDTSWFYARRGRKVAVLRPAEGGFSGRGVSVEAGAVGEGLRAGTLCPGLLPSFVAVACVNPLRCLGSFNQARYLAEIRAAWGCAADPAPALVAGRAPGEVYPLDLFARRRQLAVTEEMTMGAVWAPLLR